MTVSDKEKVELNVKKPSSDEAIYTIFNTPEIVKYKDVSGDIKEIEIRRLTFHCLEKAMSPLFKIIALTIVKGEAFLMHGIASLGNPEDMNNLKEVMLNCLNITKDELNKLPLPLFAKVLEKWLKINRDEITEFAKSFLLLKEELAKYKTELSPLLQTKSK